MNAVYDVNKYGPQTNFAEKKVLVSNQQYLPPEDYFSQEGDVWSLAILLHEIITGFLPYNKKDGRF